MGWLWLFALLVAALVAVTLWRAHRREHHAHATYPPDGELIEIDGITMHGVVSGSGPDVVLIHGSSGSVRDFTHALMPVLAKRYRVFAIDRPGLGWSDEHADGNSLSTQAALIQKTAAALGAHKPIVLGQSYGGAVALAWAVEMPETLSALVVVSGVSHPWDTGLGRLYTVLSHPVGQAVVIPLLTAFTSEKTVHRALDSVFAPQEAPPNYRHEFGPEMTLRRGSMRANARQRRALLDEIKKLAPRYGDLNLPVEIVHGTADDTVSAALHARAMERDIPQAHLVLLEGVGHMPHHVAIDDVVQAVDRAAARARLHQAKE